MLLVTMQQLELAGKRVLLRVDFNVPIHEGEVTDDTRIRAALPTIEYLLEQKSTIILMSHLGRPQGKAESSYRLGPVATRLQELLEQACAEKSLEKPKVRYQAAQGPATSKSAQFVQDAPEGSLTLLENTRFDSREKNNDISLARELAAYADVYVNDAFGTAHRAHTSTEGVAHLLPAGAGLLLQKEVDVLSKLLDNPEKPFKVILGGSKVSDKIGVIENLLPIADEILIGGAMAYTFIKAQGGSIGNSLVEDDKLELARDLLARAEASDTRITLPSDSRCAQNVAAGQEVRLMPSDAIEDGWLGLDIGDDAISTFQARLQDAKTVLWNGPLGVFEIPPFNTGSDAVAKLLADLDGYTVIGGGDSVAAANKAGVADKIDHISTGGGASLELLEGKVLPGLAVLRDNS